MFNKGLTLVEETLEVTPRFLAGHKDETTEKDKNADETKKNDKNKEKNDNLKLGSDNDCNKKKLSLKMENVGTVSYSGDTVKIGGNKTLRMKEKQEAVRTRIKRKTKAWPEFFIQCKIEFLGGFLSLHVPFFFIVVKKMVFGEKCIFQK